MTWWGRFCGLAGLILALAAPVDAVRAPAYAQTADPFAAVRKLADGGRHDQAVVALSSILNGGTLDPANTARGFFLRGVSLAKSGKNPQAISDLTNAVWLTGLTNEERAEAYRMRAAAYKAAGLGKKATADLAKARSATSASGTQTAAAEPAATATSTSGNWAAQVADGSAAATPPASAAPAATPTASQPNAVSTFFGGLFGGGATGASSTATRSAAASALDREGGGAVAAVATRPTSSARTPRKPRPVAQQVASASQAAVPDTALSSWSSSVAAAPAQPAVKRAPARKAPKKVPTTWSTSTDTATQRATTRKVAKRPVVTSAPKKKAVRRGAFNVQVATVRDRAAAERIRGAIRGDAGSALGGLSPTIDTAVLGNMGTFYRVRIDGLPSRQASTQLCRTLLKKGHDCFLLTR